MCLSHLYVIIILCLEKILHICACVGYESFFGLSCIPLYHFNYVMLSWTQHITTAVGLHYVQWLTIFLSIMSDQEYGQACLIHSLWQLSSVQLMLITLVKKWIWWSKMLSHAQAWTENVSSVLLCLVSVLDTRMLQVLFWVAAGVLWLHQPPQRVLSCHLPNSLTVVISVDTAAADGLNTQDCPQKIPPAS